MNWSGLKVGQASSLPAERASASGSLPSALPTEAGETPALRCGSGKAPGSRRRRDLLCNEGNYPSNSRASRRVVLLEETHSHFPSGVLPGEQNFVGNRLTVRLCRFEL